MEENNKDNKIEIIEPEKLKAEIPKSGNVFIKIGKLNIYNQLPAKVKSSWQKRKERFYQENMKHFLADMFLVFIILCLIGYNLFLFFSPSSHFSFQVGNLKVESLNKGVDFKIELTQTITNKPFLIASVGDEINLTINYRNTLNKALANLTITTDLGENYEYQLTGGKTTVNVENLAVGAEGKNLIKFKILKSETNLLKIQSQATIDQNGQPKTISAEPIYLKVNSALEFNALARYYTTEGDQLGLGPLPPKVGERTSYWIFWQLNNSYNDLEDITVIGFLPENVSYTGRFSVNEGSVIIYDEVQRKLIWTIAKIGKDQNNIQAALEVAIIPDVSQQGRSARLMNDLAVSGRDSFTGQILKKEISGLSTDLLYDDLAKGQGIVQ